MSVIYNKITTILNKITHEFKKSFIFTTIFSILHYIENQWINSYFFKRLYPSPHFLSFIKKNKILDKYIFSPLIVLVAFAVFLLLALNKLSFSLTLTIIIAFIAFFIGSHIIPQLLLNKNNSNVFLIKAVKNAKTGLNVCKPIIIER